QDLMAVAPVTQVQKVAAFVTLNHDARRIVDGLQDLTLHEAVKLWCRVTVSKELENVDLRSEKPDVVGEQILVVAVVEGIDCVIDGLVEVVDLRLDLSTDCTQLAKIAFVQISPDFRDLNEVEPDQC